MKANRVSAATWQQNAKRLGGSSIHNNVRETSPVTQLREPLTT
jgi:hypothetical protein